MSDTAVVLIVFFLLCFWLALGAAEINRRRPRGGGR